MTIRHLAIAGHIGVGKSSLTELLSARYRMRVFREPNHENPFLERFYGDMNRWAFRSQIFFLVSKFKLCQQMLKEESLPLVQDRTIYEDAEIFAAELSERGCLSEIEWSSYLDLYEEFVQRLPTPDLMIYLRAEVSTLQERITRRGRREEQSMPEDYLQRLHERYEQWFEGYDRSDKLAITVDELDFVHQPSDREALLAHIEGALNGSRGQPPWVAP